MNLPPLLPGVSPCLFIQTPSFLRLFNLQICDRSALRLPAITQAFQDMSLLEMKASHTDISGTSLASPDL